jgi:hypothetical protein
MTMAKTKTRTTLTADEKLYKAVQALFVLHARQVDMGNKEMREILGGDQASIDAVAKVVNKALKKVQKQKQ